MATEIRSKDYSFPEAFNAVGRKLVPGWTGDEIHVRKCRSPDEVDSMATRFERVTEYIKENLENPDLDIAKAQISLTGAELALHDRQCGPLKQEIEDLKQDHEAYQERYDLWSRLCKAERPFNDIMHHGHADGWIETPEGNILEIEPTHWGVRGGPFIPPQLPGTLGEYKGETGEVRIGKERLDAYLRTLAAGRKTRGDKNKETLQRNKRLAIACARCKTNEHPNWEKLRIAKEIAKEKKAGMEGTTLLRILYNNFPDWDKDPDWAK